MNELQRLDRELVDVLAGYEGQLTYENKPFVPDKDNVEKMLSRLKAVGGEIASAKRKHPGRVNDVLFGHWAELLELAEARLTDDKGYPYRFVRPVIGRVNSLVNFDKYDLDTRVGGLRDVLEEAPKVLDAVEDLLSSVPVANRESAVDMLNSAVTLAGSLPARMGRAFSGLAESTLEELNNLAAAMGRKAAEVLDAAKSLPEPALHEAQTGLSYPDTLRLIYGIDVQDLVDMHREEVESCDQMLYAVARGIDPRRDPFTILDEDLGPYESPEKMYEAGRWMVPFARENAVEYISLPEGETCELWETPEHLRETYPWGGYWGGNTLKGETNGAVFLNRANYRAVTKGWVELNAIHEVYPGHHAHAVKTAAARMPLTFKWSSLTAKSSPHSEGIALRSETLLKDIWHDAFPLFVAYRRLHTSTRIWCDLEMFHFGHGREAAVDLYMRYLKFSRVSAVGQAKSQELTPGYFVIYYYGMKVLERLQKKCGWNDKDFTELIFSAGKTSLKTVERLLNLDSEERASLLAKFY